MAAVALGIDDIVAGIDGRRQQAERERREHRAAQSLGIADGLTEDQRQQHEAVLDPLLRPRELEQRAHGVSALRSRPARADSGCCLARFGSSKPSCEIVSGVRGRALYGGRVNSRHHAAIRVVSGGAGFRRHEIGAAGEIAAGRRRSGVDAHAGRLAAGERRHARDGSAA